MSDAPRIVVRSHSGMPPEQAREARARVWRFVFECYAKKKAVTGEEKAGVSTVGEDAKKEVKDEFRATPRIPG